jgi:hypothetical protein
MFNKLPPELSTTFEKMIHQLDIIAKTMNIMDKRISTVENQVSELYRSSKHRKENSQKDDSYQNSYRPSYQVYQKDNQQENNYITNIYGRSGVANSISQMNVKLLINFRIIKKT